MNLSPIILFVYNRPWHTEQTLEALKKNELADKSELFIFSDGPKVDNDENVRKVREHIKAVDGFRSVTIIEREKNLGLANSVIAGVTEIVNKFGKVIVLEDDLITSKYFLKFMNEALSVYKNRNDIFSVTGYNYPSSIFTIPFYYKKSVFLNYRPMPWGWGTWREKWEKVDWDVNDYNIFKKDKPAQKLFNRGGEDLTNMLSAQIEGRIDSWYIRWCFAHFKNGRFSVSPVKSYVDNIGFDDTGVHCGKNDSVNRNSLGDYFMQPEKGIVFNKAVNRRFAAIFKRRRYDLKRFFGKIINIFIR
jgi:hypothetical protein